jgi:hypothetical protein
MRLRPGSFRLKRFTAFGADPPCSRSQPYGGISTNLTHCVRLSSPSVQKLSGQGKDYARAFNRRGSGNRNERPISEASLSSKRFPINLVIAPYLPSLAEAAARVFRIDELFPLALLFDR